MPILMKILFVLYGLSVSYVSLRPDAGVPGTFPHADKLVHLVIYALFAAMGLMASTGRTPAWFVCGGVILFGISQEVIQPYVGRSFDLIDIVANTVGVLMGYAVFAISRRYCHRLGQRKT